ncbi:hypothetical protein BKA63DRAFT_544548 [Paraphoma chrysanthemicola]|nr:hypothetical protein BKA63DRAFT_544548 [Paraphoma chrysanthemicola]
MPCWILLSLLASRGFADLGTSIKACQSLFSTLPGHVSFARDQGYEDSISSYAYIGTRLRPTCVVTPQSTEDVAVVIRVLNSFNSVAFAIRSGGHNTNKGFADIKDGVTIDLSAMNKILLNRADNTVSVGPGARWQSVYDALDPYSISVQGGRNGHVGVGGFLLGGGIGFFSPERGWACDGVVNFELVLSSGIIVNANATSNTDLFIALKGGLNNFGIVTRFDLETYKQGPMWGGVIIYPNSTDEELLDTLSAFKDPERFDPYAMLTFGWIYDTKTQVFSSNIAMYHSHPESVNGSISESFANVQPQMFNSIRTGSPGSFAGEILSPIIKEYYMHWATTTFYASRTTLSNMHASFRRNAIALTELYASANLTIACSIQSVPAAAPASNPNSLGFQPSSQPEKTLLNMGIAFQFEESAATDGLAAATEQFAKEIDQIAAQDKVRDEHLYLNYAGGWQDVFGGYGAESVENMRRVSRKYDSSGMFQNQVKGGFKLYR